MPVSSVSVRVGVLSFGPHSIVPLERLVVPSAHDLTTIRQHKKPSERHPVKHRMLQTLPHRELVTPTPCRCSQLSIRLHVPIPPSTHHHQIIWGVQKFRPTHATILPVMRHQIILGPAMPTRAIPRLHQLQDFLRDCHAPSLYLRVGMIWVRR